MKTTRTLYWMLPAVLLIAVGALFIGCESEDSPETDGLDDYFANHPYVSDPRLASTNSEITIDPSAAQVTSVGQEIIFNGRGGKGPYTWDVSKSRNGTIRSYGWSQGIYTARRIDVNDVIVYDQQGHAAIAAISAGATPTPSVTPTPTVTPTPAALAVSASPSTLSLDGSRASLTATGGSPGYSWSVQDVTLGNVNSSSGSSVGYVRNDAGDNLVTCTDSAGNTAVVVISQP
ncbi:MAG: hypothetical protein EOM20_13005 [Spartobacteria bacterium]|nr:hypothetical protein [Spartobacteria bacterium]